VYNAPAVLGETALLRDIDDQYCFRPCGLRCARLPERLIWLTG
jgi:hypothetical protein